MSAIRLFDAARRTGGGGRGAATGRRPRSSFQLRTQRNALPNREETLQPCVSPFRRRPCCRCRDPAAAATRPASGGAPLSTPSPPTSSSSSSSNSNSTSLEAVRLAASLGLRRGLRTAAAAAAESASTTSLEGRLLPAYLTTAAAPAASSSLSPSSSSSPSPPLLLRLMEQRFALGGSSGSSDGSDPTTIAKTTITVITPNDVDAIFDALQARGSVDGDPYWARVWPSAVALAECLLARPELVRGKRVADVGAGLGVAGLAAALAGAREVALLDREPLALECARLSAEATALAATGAAGGGAAGAGQAPPPFVVERPEQAGGRGVDSNSGNGDSNNNAPAAANAAAVVDATGLRALLSVREVLGYGGGGGDDDDDADGQEAATTPTPTTATTTVVRAVAFDWHERPLPPSLRSRFDVALACDVLYEQDAVGPLAEVLPLLLSTAGDGRVLLADPPARTAANRERFLELLASSKGGGAARQGQRRRFAVDEASLAQCAPRQLDRELQGGQAGDRPVPVQLLHLRAVDGNDTVGLLKAGGAGF